MTDLSKPAAESGHLHRSVGLTSLMFISLGSIIGSGWLLGALTAAKAAGGASLISWLLAGVATARSMAGSVPTDRFGGAWCRT